jgi:alkylation response protein AidB-like acyl-CoA dehydrogenase
MKQPPNPSSFLPAGIADILRSRAAEAEVRRDLHPDQLELIYEQQWFRMLMPGAPLPLPELVRLEEGISWADGAVGWMVTLCSGAGWFAGFFPPDAFPEVFSQKQVCLAGSGAPTGEAHIIAGGYRVSGRWDYASGAVHATAFTANCVIIDKGQKVLTADGLPLIRPFLFKKEEVVVDAN